MVELKLYTINIHSQDAFRKEKNIWNQPEKDENDK